ncbi:MAG: nitroreductase family protein [Candidatus Latescibacterota bacterium]
MHHSASRVIRFAIAALLACSATLSAQNLKPVKLPEPGKTGGMPLMEALANRKSTREFTDRKLAPQTLSNLLWAAYGVNRPDGRRTAPSSVNWQTLDVYVALPEGMFLYEAKTNTLQPVLGEDIRALTGSQPYVGTAALNLVYVADLSRIPGDISVEQKVSIATADVGFIGQNVYLFCASEGLGCVVRGLIDKDALAKKMGLKPEQRVILAHSAGYPK